MMRSFFRLSTLVSLVLAVGSGALLYTVSQSVHLAEGRLEGIEEMANGEEQQIRILKAEWDYLNHPIRLEELAHLYLDMDTPVSESQISDVSAIPDQSDFIPVLDASDVDQGRSYSEISAQKVSVTSDDDAFSGVMQKYGNGGKR